MSEHTNERLEVAGPYPRVTVGFHDPAGDDPECGVVGFRPLAELFESAEAYGDCSKVPDAARLALCWNSHDALVAALTECLAIVRLKCGNLHDDTNAIQDRAIAALAAAKEGM
jgi:hypothetical protein